MMQLNERVEFVKREGKLIYRSGRTGLADALEATEAEGLESQTTEPTTLPIATSGATGFSRLAFVQQDKQKREAK